MSKTRKTDDDALLDAALALIAEQGYTALSLGEVAKAAGVPLAAVYRAFSSKAAIIEALIRRTDLAVLDALDAPASGDDARDRLFDLLMQRFEASASAKDALRVLHRDVWRRPGQALAAGPALLRGMRWMLDAAGLDSTGLVGLARAHALAVIYLSVQPIWLEDDDPGLARTMAALDRRLRRSAELLPGAWRSRRDIAKEEAAAPT